MKILLVSTAPDGSRKVSGGADSALLRPGEPVFTDVPLEDWELKVAIAMRISRLGLHIPLRHAPRHYDAFGAVALRLLLSDDGVPALFHDRAVSPGAWIDAGAFAGGDLSLAAMRRPLPGRASEAVDVCTSISAATLQADDVVSWLSQTMTLKTGDIIIFADSALSLGAPLPDTAVTATVGGRESLSVRIK